MEDSGIEDLEDYVFAKNVVTERSIRLETPARIRPVPIVVKH